jgi:hypothetical protein
MTRSAPLTKSIAPPIPLTTEPGTIQFGQVTVACDLYAAKNRAVDDVTAAGHREAGGQVENKA